MADIRNAVPTAGDDYIREVLRELRTRKVIELEGRGRAAGWRRLTTTF